MTTGELITRWTIRVALLLCAAALGTRLWAVQAAEIEGARIRFSRIARGLWTLAFGCYLVHLAAAFSFYHHWSHAAAWEHTAQRTNEVLGIHWGGGVWFNYAFTLAWAADVAWLWLQPTEGTVRSLWLTFAWYAWFLVIVFFATVVFEAGTTRWVAVGILTLLGVAVIKAHRSQFGTTR